MSQDMPATRVILASQSPQRQKLFGTLGIEFKVQPADIDEAAIQHEDPFHRAQLVAVAKAEKVLRQYPQAIVIAADTYVVVDGQTLEKPVDLAEAKDMLLLQSGKVSQAVSGVAYFDHHLHIFYEGYITTQVRFRELSEWEIDQYVAQNPVLTWSAAFSPAYDPGMALIESIEGSLTSFTHGLPLEVVVPLLVKSGVVAGPKN